MHERTAGALYDGDKMVLVSATDVDIIPIIATPHRLGAAGHHCLTSCARSEKKAGPTAHVQLSFIGTAQSTMYLVAKHM